MKRSLDARLTLSRGQTLRGHDREYVTSAKLVPAPTQERESSKRRAGQSGCAVKQSVVLRAGIEEIRSLLAAPATGLACAPLLAAD